MKLYVKLAPGGIAHWFTPEGPSIVLVPCCLLVVSKSIPHGRFGMWLLLSVEVNPNSLISKRIDDIYNNGISKIRHNRWSRPCTVNA
jgi:hypothetical protein